MVSRAKRVVNFEDIDPQSVCYWKVSDGSYMIHFPTGGDRPVDGHIGNLRGHQVTENPDGTLTVHPSILISDGSGNQLVHGFLVNDEWRPC